MYNKNNENQTEESGCIGIADFYYGIVIVIVPLLTRKWMWSRNSWMGMETEYMIARAELIYRLFPYFDISAENNLYTKWSEQNTSGCS